MKKNSNILYADFEKEITGSAYQRTRIMMGAFTIGFVVSLANYFLLNDDILQFYGGTFNYFIIVSWLALFIVYEFIVGRQIKSYVKRKKQIGKRCKIAHLFIEITLVSLVIFYMVGIKKMVIFLDSPLNLLYYLFLILSVLHLDKKISFFTGVLGAIQYAFNCWYAFHIPGAGLNLIANTTENTYYLDCIVLIVSGVAASYVAGEVKRFVKVSLEARQAKNEMEILFGQQVSQEVVNALVQDKGLTKHEATVLAMDIRNFTGFAENHSPGEIMDFQNKIFGPILDIVGQYGGVVNQIMGDGLMATFGILASNPRHAEMAFLAALKIREKVRELSGEGIIPATRIGLGIHTGEVVTGNIGNETRKQYSISGSAVIIAFRVEQLNKEFDSELLITGQVRVRIARTISQLSYLGLKPIKGFEYEVDVYQAA
ncbi:MAG: adenylate/guanylate cyclase domain-containing protein [Ferruginibacter sp.]